MSALLVEGRAYSALFRRAPLIVAALLLLSGCPSVEPVPDGPGPTPMNGPVRPGATCDPTGLAGTAADGTPMVCGADGKWRMAVRAS